ncbi:MAG: hypothetical protein V3V25_09525 [Paracoccaceae bacterium]
MPFTLRSVLNPSIEIVSIGAILAVCSELWFYQVNSDTLSVWLFFVYGVFGYIFLWAIRHFQVRGFAGFFVGAALFGFLIEGIVVNVLYEALPFSILWTSLAWHALLSVSVGYYFYRRVMGAGTLWQAILLNGSIGLFLGLWNGYIWNVVDGPDGGVVEFIWGDPTDFVLQFLLGYIVFLFGHIGFDWLAAGQDRGNKPAYILSALLLLALFALGPLIGIFPFSLLLPVLIALSLIALKAGTKAAPNIWLTQFENLRINKSRYLVSLFIPLGAAFGYFGLFWSGINFEANVVVILICGPISVLLWGISLYRLFQQKHST